MEALSAPVHVMVGDPLARRSTAAFVTSLHLGPLPPGSSVPAGGGVSVASPEMCFAQLANALPFAQLVLLGCELCGTYMPNRRSSADGPESRGLPRPPGTSGDSSGEPDGDEFAPQRKSPLTTPGALARLLESSPGLPGRRAATRALRYVHTLAASPMESVIALLLCLPRHYGGLGLPSPRLNARVDLDSRARAISGHGYHLVDLLWEEAGIGAEYDGRSAHARAAAFDEDRLRANALKTMGVDSVSFTAATVRDDRRFCSQASFLAERLRIRRRPLGEKWPAARTGLRRELFGQPTGSARPVWPGELAGLPCLLDVLGAERRG